MVKPFRNSNGSIVWGQHAIVQLTSKYVAYGGREVAKVAYLGL
jgi:hypothetical protein